MAERAKGGARLLVVVYAIFAIAATARSIIQLSTRFDEAPLAYTLSAIAAVVYIVATIALARADRTSRRVARAAMIFELSGVVIVGTASLLFPVAFPRATAQGTFAGASDAARYLTIAVAASTGLLAVVSQFAIIREAEALLQDLDRVANPTALTKKIASSRSFLSLTAAGVIGLSLLVFALVVWSVLG